MKISLAMPEKGPEWLPSFARSIVRWLNELTKPRKYTVATLPDPAGYEGYTVYVSDETGGGTLAFSDGTDWRRAQDRNIVS